MYKICFVTTISLTLRCFFLEFAETLHDSGGFEVHFVCDDDAEFEKQLPEYITFHPIPMKRGISLSAFGVIRKMEKLFRKEQFDMVQFSTPNAAFYASIAAKRAGIPVRNYHLMGFRYLGFSGVLKTGFKQIERISCKNATDIECVSKSNLELGIREGLFPREKAVVVWNGSTGGVDLERFNVNNRERWRKEIREELHLDQDDFVYGFVGRITADKGINELLEAFLKLNNGSKLVLTGYMTDLDTIDRDLLAQAKRSPDIIFHESMQDIERCYAALDVLILPSYREGFGNVVIEAAAVGTPGIVSDIPGPIDAIIKDVTACTVTPKSVDSLLRAMEHVYHSDYVTMGQNAAVFAKECFDSKILNQKNLERKYSLLNKPE